MSACEHVSNRCTGDAENCARENQVLKGVNLAAARLESTGRQIGQQLSFSLITNGLYTTHAFSIRRLSLGGIPLLSPLQCANKVSGTRRVMSTDAPLTKSPV